MEPMDINGGRFYARPLRDDDNIAIEQAQATEFGSKVVDAATAREAWLDDSAYSWAVCEQTNVNAVAIAHYDLTTRDLEVSPVGELERDLPNDPMLPPKKVKDGVEEGREAIERWIKGYLGD